MRKIISSTIASFAMIFALTGCNVQVEQGTVAKVLGPTGFQPEVYPPGVVNIDNGIFTRASKQERLIFVETTTEKFKEPIEVLLKDKLKLSFEVVFRGRNTTDKKRLDAIFNDMKMDDDRITTREVYEVYGKMIVMNTARAVVSKYNVDEVNVNYQRITAELYAELLPKLKNIPMDISDVTIGAIEYPKSVTAAIESANERRMKITTQKAQTQIELTKKRGQEQLASADYRIKMLEAKRIRDYNAMTAKGITPELITLRKLELKDKELDVRLAEANKWNGTLPATVMNGNIPVIANTSR